MTTLQIGDWFRIKPKKDNGGAPLIRIEELGHRVMVSDWESFAKKVAPLHPKLEPEYRSFGVDAEEAKKRLRHWNRVTPNEKLTSGATPEGVNDE